MLLLLLYIRTRYDGGGRLGDWIQALLQGQLMQLSQLQSRTRIRVRHAGEPRMLLSMKRRAFLIPLSVECHTDFAECRPGTERDACIS